MKAREGFETDLLNNMNSRAENEENHFHRVPEELIVSIFNKLPDLKCLCRCSLVSKHFAAVVNRVQTVSVTIIGRATYDKEFLKKLHEVTGVEKLHLFLDSPSLKDMKLMNFLDKLTELQCINLDFENPEKDVNSTYPMCKIKLCRNCAKVESFVALESLYMDNDTENEAGEEGDIERKVEMLLQRVKESWWQFRVRYIGWIAFIFLLMKCHSLLQRVTITDIEIHGKLAIDCEQGVLVELLEQFFGRSERIGVVPVLRLPLSGYVMRYVAMMIVDFSENSGVRANNLDDIAFWDFGEELPVLREAVKEYLKNHKDELITL